MDTFVGHASIAGFFLFLLLIYCVHIQLRRRKYMQIASELGAEYQSQGLFKTGKITAAGDHRKYTIENKDGARGSGIWTIIELRCDNKGIPLYIHGHFFKNFPNWKYAFTLGNRTERVFIANITLQNAGVPLEEKYKIEVQSLFQEFALLDAQVFKKGNITIGKETIRFTVHGILKKLDVIRQIVSILTGIAERIESSPIA